MKAAPLNPMTGHRTDLEVTKEDGAAAEATHRRWTSTRVSYLQQLLEQCSEEARPVYQRELDRLCQP